MVARPGAAAACFLLRMLPSPGQQQQQSMPEATTSFTPTLGDSSEEVLGCAQNQRKHMAPNRSPAQQAAALMQAHLGRQQRGEAGDAVLGHGQALGHRAHCGSVRAARMGPVRSRTATLRWLGPTCSKRGSCASKDNPPPVHLWNRHGAVHSCCVSAVSSGLLACRAAFAHLTSRGRRADLVAIRSATAAGPAGLAGRS